LAEHGAHARVRLDRGDAREAVDERTCELAGAGGEVEHLRLGSQSEAGRHEVERVGGVLGPDTVVVGGAAAEAERPVHRRHVHVTSLR
jgi:hypothetical protein